MNIGIILSGGTGTRFGSNLPKQYHTINNKQIISFAIDAFKQSKKTDKIIIVAGANYVKELKNKYALTTIEGGNTRNITVDNAINYIGKNLPETKKVIFADSVRPMISSNYIDRIFDLLDSYDGVITAPRITDSLYRSGQGIVNRDNYRLIQTPEGFKMDILSNFDRESDATAIVKQFERYNIFYSDELTNNFKVTYPEDLLIVKVLLGEKND